MTRVTMRVIQWPLCPVCNRQVNPKLAKHLPSLDYSFHTRCAKTTKAVELVADRITQKVNGESYDLS